jgi:hypothetical protein
MRPESLSIAVVCTVAISCLPSTLIAPAAARCLCRHISGHAHLRRDGPLDCRVPPGPQALGIRDGIARRGNRWHDMSRWSVRRNELISYSRAPVEPLFALLKNTYRFARARHRGLFAMPPNGPQAMDHPESSLTIEPGTPGPMALRHSRPVPSRIDARLKKNRPLMQSPRISGPAARASLRSTVALRRNTADWPQDVEGCASPE